MLTNMDISTGHMVLVSFSKQELLSSERCQGFLGNVSLNKICFTVLHGGPLEKQGPIRARVVCALCLRGRSMLDGHR